MNKIVCTPKMEQHQWQWCYGEHVFPYKNLPIRHFGHECGKRNRCMPELAKLPTQLQWFSNIQYHPIVVLPALENLQHEIKTTKKNSMQWIFLTDSHTQLLPAAFMDELEEKNSVGFKKFFTIHYLDSLFKFDTKESLFASWLYG